MGMTYGNKSELDYKDVPVRFLDWVWSGVERNAFDFPH